MRSAFIKPFGDTSKGHQRFDADLAQELEWSLFTAPIHLSIKDHGVFVHSAIGSTTESLTGKKHNPLLADWLDNFQKDSKDFARVWIPDHAFDEAGHLVLDPLLGINLPEDFEPVRVKEIHLRGEKLNPRYTRWLDLCPGAESPDGGRYFFNSRSEVSEVKQLIASVQSVAHDGYSSTEQVFMSRAAARKAVETWVEAPLRAVAASDLPDAPMPPEGYERWFVVGDDSA